MDLFNSAECGPSNSLQNLSKELERDRSLYQDRFDGPGSSSVARGRPLHGLRDQELAEEFFNEQHQSGLPGFDMRGMSKELDALGPPIQLGPRGVDWTGDFLSQAGPSALVADDRQFAEMDTIFRREQALVPSAARGDWAADFQNFHHDVTGKGKMAEVHHEEFEKAFHQASEAQWAQEFDKQENGWAHEFNEQNNNSSWAEEFEASQKEIDITGSSNEALSKTAGLLLDIVENSTNPKFKNSKFLGFMKQIRDQELSIEGNKVVETVKPVGSALDWAKEFNSSVTTQSWEEEFSMDSKPPAPADFASEFLQQHRPKDSWAHEFSLSENAGPAEMEDREAQAMEDAFQSYMNPQMRKEEARALEWENDWGNFTPQQQNYDYTFIANNPYVNRPVDVQEKAAKHGNLAESILALEAILQRDEKNAEAWQSLGLRQQENENDNQAIAALRKAVTENPTLLDSWSALAVSYANEGIMSDAYDALESWLKNSDKYKGILESANRQNLDRPAFLTEVLMQAARINAGHDLDPSVQLALGVLFNLTQEYSKAVDCFEASLSKKPQDYMLWNKLGATLANSRSHERALDAYYNALQLNPAFIRARFNLSVSCIQLGIYKEAAEHILAALSIQEGNVHGIGEGDGNLSESLKNSGGLFSDTLWSSLRNLLEVHLQRRDLLEAVEQRNLDLFKDKTESAIERTPEYDEFMTDLENFHKLFGFDLSNDRKDTGATRTNFGREKAGLVQNLQMGARSWWISKGKLHHSRRCYTDTCLTQVTDDRGWKRITAPFNLPATCTNSAYVVKQVYQKNLLYYELVKIQKQPIEPLLKRAMEEAEEESADANAAGGDAKRQRQDFTHPSGFQQPPRAQFTPQQVAANRYTPAAAPARTVPAAPAVESGLPNEVDWAFNKLVKLSFTCHSNFHIGTIAGLLDSIIAYADPFFIHLKLNTALDNFETTVDDEGWTTRKDGKQNILPVFSDFTIFNTTQSSELMERVMQVMHILRNFSFLDHHARFFISQHSILTILAKAIALPSYSWYVEVKQYSLDIFENLAGCLQLRGKNDFYLACLKKMLFDPNRSIVLGALRSLTKLCSNEVNHSCLSDIDPESFAKLFQHLTVKDDELVYAVLEFIYVHTCLGTEVSLKIASASPTNIVRTLTSVLKLRTTADTPLPVPLPNVAELKDLEKQAAKAALQKIAEHEDKLARNWLSENYDVIPDGYLIMSSLKSDFIAWSSKQPKSSLNFDKVLNTLRKFAPTASISQTDIKGLARKQNNAMDIDKGRGKFGLGKAGSEELEGENDGDEVLAEGDVSMANKPPESTHLPFQQPTPQPAFPPQGLVPNMASPVPVPFPYASQFPNGGSFTPNLPNVPMTMQFLMPPNMNSPMPPGLPPTPQGHMPGMPKRRGRPPKQRPPERYGMFMSTPPNFQQMQYYNQQLQAQQMMSNVEQRPKEAERQQEYVREEKRPEEVLHTCFWKLEDEFSNVVDDCMAQFSTEKELIHHLGDVHVFPNSQLHGCMWKSCPKKFTESTSHQQIMNHIYIHLGASAVSANASSTAATFEDSSELVGVPLTTLLILRNLARAPRNRDLFMTYENDLVEAACRSPKYSKMVSEILWELH
ncbi:Peroxisomal membrane signal receptor PTS1 [Phlyctochytrium planicorne]|nr:Peroxisomal membrane signal receptor PTS1 [Phlyctochytrium planicorne]